MNEPSLQLDDPADVWVGLYRATGVVPLAVDVREALRRSALDGASGYEDVSRLARGRRSTTRPTELSEAPTLVDVGDRTEPEVEAIVARLLPRWESAHGVVPVRWVDGALCRVADDVALVPRGGVYVGLGRDLTWSVQHRLLSLLEYSGLSSGVLGHDIWPITSAEAAEESVPSAHANRLAALRHVDRVVTFSEASAVVHRGWRTMLGGAGLSGPEILVVPPATDPVVDTGQEPVRVFEPTDAVRAALVRLREEGLEVDGPAPARFGVSVPLDRAYDFDAASCLAAGLPVVTSDFGSMREIAEGGGALMVDPRDDDALTDALRRLLTDDELLDRLRAEARARPRRTWDEYADEAWAALTGGGPTQPTTAATAAS